MLSDVAPPQRPLFEFLFAAGFNRDLVRAEFPVPLAGTLARLDVVAFGRSVPQDLTTAAVAGEYVANGNGRIPLVLDAARSLATPLAVINADEDGLGLWRIGATAHTDELLGSDSNARELAGRFASISPESLMAAKSGQQLTLFPTDARLLAAARRGSSDRLSGLVDEALGRVVASEGGVNATDWQRITRLVVQALAALVVRDKFELDAQGLGVIDAAAARFPEFFAGSATLSAEAIVGVTAALDVLGRGVNYMGLDSAVISRVYENAVVTAATRTQQGIYYTPADLAQSIASAVPFEEIAPEARRVLDPSCGSGTLLVAAHDRLARLLPDGASVGYREQYLRAHLAGWDSDPFAVELAKLSMLLHSLPYGNHWQVNVGDALNSEVAEDARPSFVLSNPPWRGQRSVDGARFEQALPFLRQMVRLAAPGGFVAAILPASWLSSRVARESREWLTRENRLFEVWRLPEGTFESAHLAPCVVFIRVGQPTSGAWVYRRVRRGSLESFTTTGSADEQWLLKEPTHSVESSLLRGPFDVIQAQLGNLPTLGSVAEILSSPVPEPGLTLGQRGDFLLLETAGELPAYGRPSNQSLVRVAYPDDFHRAGVGRGPLLRRPKVLVSSRRSPANPWRLKVGLDTLGVIPRESMHMATPRTNDEDGLFALLALLGSRLASAWIDTYEPKRSIGTALLRSFPVPPPGPAWAVLSDAGRRLFAASDTDELSALARAVDGLIEAMYGLPDRVRDDLDAAFEGELAPEGRVRYHGGDDSRTRDADVGAIHGVLEQDLFGAVLGVDPPLIRVWVPGFTPETGVEIALPQGMRGWMCAPGATFDVRVGTSLARAQYRYQPKAYLEFAESTLPSGTKL
jgi:SAM-dependent methyltransferase